MFYTPPKIETPAELKKPGLWDTAVKPTLETIGGVIGTPVRGLGLLATGAQEQLFGVPEAQRRSLTLAPGEAPPVPGATKGQESSADILHDLTRATTAAPSLPRLGIEGVKNLGGAIGRAAATGSAEDIGKAALAFGTIPLGGLMLGGEPGAAKPLIPSSERAFAKAHPLATGAEAIAEPIGELGASFVEDPALALMGPLGESGRAGRIGERLLGASFVPGMAEGAYEGVGRTRQAAKEHGALSPEALRAGTQTAADAILAGFGLYHGLRPGEGPEPTRTVTGEVIPPPIGIGSGVAPPDHQLGPGGDIVDAEIIGSEEGQQPRLPPTVGGGPEGPVDAEIVREGFPRAGAGAQPAGLLQSPEDVQASRLEDAIRESVSGPIGEPRLAEEVTPESVGLRPFEDVIAENVARRMRQGDVPPALAEGDAALQKRITDGLASGDLEPTVKSLVDTLGITPSRARRTLDRLQAETPAEQAPAPAPAQPEPAEGPEVAPQVAPEPIPSRAAPAPNLLPAERILRDQALAMGLEPPLVDRYLGHAAGRQALRDFIRGEAPPETAAILPEGERSMPGSEGKLFDATNPAPPRPDLEAAQAAPLATPEAAPFAEAARAAEEAGERRTTAQEKRAIAKAAKREAGRAEVARLAAENPGRISVSENVSRETPERTLGEIPLDRVPEHLREQAKDITRPLARQLADTGQMDESPLDALPPELQEHREAVHDDAVQRAVALIDGRQFLGRMRERHGIKGRAGTRVVKTSEPGTFDVIQRAKGGRLVGAAQVNRNVLRMIAGGRAMDSPLSASRIYEILDKRGVQRDDVLSTYGAESRRNYASRRGRGAGNGPRDVQARPQADVGVPATRLAPPGGPGEAGGPAPAEELVPAPRRGRRLPEPPKDERGNPILPGQEDWTPARREAVRAAAMDYARDAIEVAKGAPPVPAHPIMGIGPSGVNAMIGLHTGSRSGLHGTPLEGMATPRQIEEALVKDRGNALEKRVLEAVDGDVRAEEYEQRIEDQHAEAAAPPDAVAPEGEGDTSFDFGDKASAEVAPAEPHKFASTQIQLPPELADHIREMAAKIPDDILAEDGRETDPHVTVKYGLHSDEVSPVRDLLAGEPPIKVSLGKVSIFPAKEGAPYDVVKVDVDSPDLHRLNAKIAESLPVTDTHPEYKPHVTLAYVKPGEGEQFVGDTSLEGQQATIGEVRFSDRQGGEHSIPLGGGERSAPKPGRFFDGDAALGRLKSKTQASAGAFPLQEGAAAWRDAVIYGASKIEDFLRAHGKVPDFASWARAVSNGFRGVTDAAGNTLRKLWDAAQEAFRSRKEKRAEPTAKPRAAPEPQQASIPFIITRAQRARLREKGYTEAQVDAMTPGDAHDILNGKPPRGAKVPDGATPTLRDKLLEAWKAGLLSGPPTHVAKALGDILRQGLTVADTAFTSHVTAPLLKHLTGIEADRYRGEVAASFGAIKGKMPDVLRQLGRDFKDLSTLAPEKLAENPLERHPAGAIGGKFGRAVRIPFRSFEAITDAARSLAGEQELYKQAFRAAKAAGGDVAEGAAKIIKDYNALSPKSRASRYAKIHSAVESARMEQVFNRPMDERRWLDASADAIIKLNRKVGPSNVIFPFVKIPARITSTVLEHSPWGALYIRHALADFHAGKIGAGELADSITKPVLGTMIGGMFAAAAAQGMLTGEGPKDPKDKQALIDSGWQPYSVVIPKPGGGKMYISFKRLQPIAPLMGLAADMMDAKDEKSAADSVQKIGGSVLENIVDETYMAGLTNLSNVLADPTRYAGQFVKNLAGTVVPGAVGKLAQAIDPTVRDTAGETSDTKGFLQSIGRTIEARIPGLSETLQAKATAIGETAERGGNAAWRFLSPLAASSDREDRALAKELVDLDAVPSIASRSFTIPRSGGQKIQLSDEELAVLHEGNEAASERIKRWVAEGALKRLDPEEARKRILAAYQHERDIRRNKLMRDPAFKAKIAAARQAAKEIA